MLSSCAFQSIFCIKAVFVELSCSIALVNESKQKSGSNYNYSCM